MFLTNLQSTNAGTYTVVATNSFGSTTSIVAIITVDLRATLSVATANANVVISAQGNPGSSYRLLCATNLSSDTFWSPIQTNTLPSSGSFVWTLPVLTNGNAFYRAVSP